MDALTFEERAFGDYSSGRYGWLLREPVLFSDSIPARGMPGLWFFESDRIGLLLKN
ncbi:MAG: hypothetical protein WKF35_07670 [Ferruginibacter sp.]